MTPQVEEKLSQVCLSIINSKDKQNQRIIAQAQNLKPIISAIEEDMLNLQSQLKSSRQEVQQLSDYIATHTKKKETGFLGLSKSQNTFFLSKSALNFASTPQKEPEKGALSARSFNEEIHRQTSRSSRNPFKDSLKFFEEVLSKSSEDLKRSRRHTFSRSHSVQFNKKKNDRL